ncbi:thioredoxin [Corallococcus coralloides DSM 2259]|uniref:Thioredoxin n=1 Tax=Corallococcus coralloides (strain ATCC 25202 / DSM 2259 / NBRC 100086 / M2) TaxID=1144275 RepID=H8MMP3_CORCM|nr:thioredoxin [Corallococcus coralloides]AFE10557.1 thioredoxin [Corallococcus coralloides DSM 2259]
MATLEITKDNFKETVGKSGIVILDWWATWCGPCRAFAPIFESTSNKHADIVFGKIDTDAQPELSGAFEIRSIPTLMVFRDGILLFEQPGAMPAAALEDLLKQVRALNMDDVRREVEAQRAAKEAPKA